MNPSPYEGHSSDVIGNETLKWLKEQRDGDKPFFLMCHFKAPHGIWENAPTQAVDLTGVSWSE